MDYSQGHLKLEVWKQSIDFVSELYSITNNFPKHELYGIVSQIRRAGVSIPANIAEGAARKGNKEFLHFISISMGSISEAETLLTISERIHYLDESQFTKLTKQLSTISRMLIGLRNSLLKTTQPDH